MTVEALHYPSDDTRGIGRWTASLVTVLALHGIGAALLLAWQGPSPETVAPPAVIMIELAPPVPPKPIVEPPKPPPEPVKQEVAPPAPPTPAPNPTVAFPPPRPKPIHHVDPVPPKDEPVPPTAVTQPPPQVAVAPVVTEPPRPAVPPSYEGLLVAQLQRLMRYPAELRRHGIMGTVLVRFTLDRSGRVLFFTLAQSSGHIALDDEALATLRRADPLPGFPPEMAGATHNFTVPLVFRLAP